MLGAGKSICSLDHKGSNVMQHRKRPHIIAIDGYDGSGKTSIATKLAQHLSGVYVKPFRGGTGGPGPLIIWLSERREYDLANNIALACVDWAIDNNRDADILVFDRHWMSIISALPKDYMGRWCPLPRTVLCWTTPEVTARRLAAREEPAISCEMYASKIEAYIGLAHSHNIPILNTTDLQVDDAALRALSLLDSPS